MKIDNKYIMGIGSEILKTKELHEKSWDYLSLVVDTNEGHFAESGFLYVGTKITPFTSSSDTPLALRDKVFEFRDEVNNQSGGVFKQLLIQIQSKTNRIKIDFEFDDPERWSIKPAKLKEMREKLRPSFS